VLTQYKTWFFIPLTAFSIILIALKVSHFYVPSPKSHTVYPSDAVVAADMRAEHIVLNKIRKKKKLGHFDLELQEIERKKAELQALSASIDEKIKALRDAETSVLELLEDTQSHEQ